VLPKQSNMRMIPIKTKIVNLLKIIDKIDQLTGENLKKAEPLKDILTEDFCQKLFSKSWNAKEDALKWLDT
jgi:hypothetical protein